MQVKQKKLRKRLYFTPPQCEKIDILEFHVLSKCSVDYCFSQKLILCKLEACRQVFCTVCDQRKEFLWWKSCLVVWCSFKSPGRRRDLLNGEWKSCLDVWCSFTSSRRRRDLLNGEWKSCLVVWCSFTSSRRRRDLLNGEWKSCLVVCAVLRLLGVVETS